MKYWIGILAAVILSTSGLAQVVLENNPTSLKWYQVNTSHFRVLYPAGFEQQAQRMANTLERVHDPEARTMGSDPKKISVVLQNQSSVSNGFVSITPRRSEFYTMPTQDYNFVGTNDWLNLLASHEYRHIAQFQHSRRGITNALYYLFGANTQSLLTHMVAPQWFWEGDAVSTETAFTHSGRGRIPNFGLIFRTNLLEGRTFNYQKQYLRSYKDFVPDHYVLGYHMVSYLRRKTGDPHIWEKITARAWNVPVVPFRFSSAIKMETGMTVNGLYRSMAGDLRKAWQAELDTLKLNNFTTVNDRVNKAYTNYSFPQLVSNGDVLALKDGIGDIETFVLLKDGNEKKVFVPGFYNGTGMLSVSGSTVVWNEFGYDPRWVVRNYSLIKAYDIVSKQLYVIGDRKNRYAGAALSPDGKLLVTVRSDNAYGHSLVVLSFPDGKIVKEFPNPGNDFYSMARWSSDGKNIVTLKTTAAGRTITVVDWATSSAQDIFPVTSENIGHPVMDGGLIYFNSPVSGIDNIYAVDINSKQRYQVTCTKYGAYNPALSADGKVIYYNEQTKNGLDVVKVANDIGQWKRWSGVKESNFLADNLARQEGRSGLLDTIPQTVFPVKRYSKLRGMFNPHSWGPLLSNDITRPTVQLSSQDILSTTMLNAGYQFDINERAGGWIADFTYQGLYPIIDVSIAWRDRKVDLGNKPLTTDYITVDRKVITGSIVDQHVKLQWRELNAEAGLRLPLNLTQSKYQTELSVGAYTGITKASRFTNGINNRRSLLGLVVYDSVKNPLNGNITVNLDSGYYNFPEYVGNNTLYYNHLSFSFSHLMKVSRRDIISKWGQSLYVNYYNTSALSDLKGANLSVYGNLIFPGLFKHHSFYTSLSYQHTTLPGSTPYMFANNVPFARGQYFSRFEKVYTIQGNYTLPIWYPDFHIGPLLNVQRVRLNGFMDYTSGMSRYFGGENLTYLSAGGELKFDFNMFRFLPQFNVGVRVTQGLSPVVSRVELLIGAVNF